MNPLKDIHLQRSIHISKVSIGNTTLKTETLKSLREIGPQADNEYSLDVRAAAAMCQYAYFYLNQGRKPSAELIDGWKPMSPFEVDKLISPGFHQKLKRDSTGFSSMFFQKDINGIQYYAFCTEGTDMTSLLDWYSNFSQGLNGNAPQYSYSVHLAKLIDHAIGDEAVLWFIGHSLGGGLASNNSLATGRHAITFNAAGLHPNRILLSFVWDNGASISQFQKRTKQIHAFVIEGEILNSVLRWIGQPAYGDRKLIKLNQSGKSMIDKHSMVTLLDHLEMKHD